MKESMARVFLLGDFVYFVRSGAPAAIHSKTKPLASAKAGEGAGLTKITASSPQLRVQVHPGSSVAV